MWGTGEARASQPHAVRAVRAVTHESAPWTQFPGLNRYAGAQQRDHCNARKASSWDHLRSLARGGRMAEVRAAYDNPASSSSVATAPETLDLSRPSAALPALLPRKSAIKPSSSKPQAPAKLAPAKPKQPPAVTAAKAGAWLNLGASSSGSVRIPPGLVVMPDPVLDNNAIELGSFTFNVEVRRAFACIASLLLLRLLLSLRQCTGSNSSELFAHGYMSNAACWLPVFNTFVAAVAHLNNLAGTSHPTAMHCMPA